MNYTEPTLAQRAEILSAYGESKRLVREAERKQITGPGRVRALRGPET